jgi:hypothetical protein
MNTRKLWLWGAFFLLLALSATAGIVWIVVESVQ